MQWTREQQAAIDARNDTVLVSAAAGSGKTAVLVERVVQLVREGGDITRMLIVTFTRAAAGEMRERIAAALEKAGAQDARILKQALRVNRAQISTIHNFCARVLKEHFEVLNIDPLAHIGETASLNALKTRVLEDVLEDACQDPTPDEAILFSCYEEEDIVDMLDKLYRFLMSLADPWAWTERACAPIADDIRKHPAYKALLSACEMQLQGAEHALEMCERTLGCAGAPQRYAITYAKDEAILGEIMLRAKEQRLTGEKITFPTLSTGKKNEGELKEVADAYKAYRTQFQDAVKAALSLLPMDDNAAVSDVRDTLPVLNALCGLCHKFSDAYFKQKQQRNWLDYNDLEHLCYQALENEKVRRSVSQKYDSVFVDEYQDVSGIQEAIIEAVHQGNMLFLVGDVKQSIYRFRLADPTLFIKRYHAFSTKDDAVHRKILLQRNYRSDKNILLAVNHVFSHAMRERVTEIAYDERAALSPAPDAAQGAAVEVDILVSDRTQDAPLRKAYLYEAELAACKIRALVGKVSVRDRGGERPAKYRDIVILLRNASSHAAIIARILGEHDIPVYSDADATYFELSEITDMLNLLRVIDNPFQDIPLLSVLRCPCFSFSEEELARIRLTAPGGCPFHQAFFGLSEGDGPLSTRVREVKARLDDWRLFAAHFSVETLIKRLMEETGLYMAAGAHDEGEARQANLRLLAERAAANSDSDLHTFLTTVESMRQTDDTRTAKTLSDSEDVVRIMTMHKSKGLQFPIVFLLELARPFRKDSGETLILSVELGAGISRVNSQERTERPTFVELALRADNARKNRAEEARLLYVAMTRAQERLYLFNAPQSIKASRAAWSMTGEMGAGSADAMFDWIGQTLRDPLLRGENCAYTADNGARYDILWQSVEDMRSSASADAFTPAPPDEGDIPPLIEAMLNRQKPDAPVLKTSVSALAKRLRTQEDEEETSEDKRNVSRETLAERPRFMMAQGMTGAERGTVIHKTLGCIDYALVENKGVEAALHALRTGKQLSATEYSAIRVADIDGFFKSGLGVRALRAKTLQREWAFNLKVEDNTIVQGVIDLCFVEQGAWVLVDYKTDAYQTADVLAARYQSQLTWYARALKELTGLPVREALLYGIQKGDIIPIKVEN